MQKAASVALYKDLIKQLVKFAKSLVIPLEDLQDNVLDGNIAKKAATDIQQVCLPAAVGLCQSAGREWGHHTGCGRVGQRPGLG